MTDMIPEIDILVKTHKGQKNYHFSDREIIVGRSKKTNLYIPLEGMSRQHFKIAYVGQGLAIVDLGSANGTLLNNIPLKKNEPTPFLKGDVIEIPGVKISFSITFKVAEEEVEILITEDMITEEENEDSYSTGNEGINFSQLQVMPKEIIEKTVLTDSAKDVSELRKSEEKKNIEFNYEEDEETSSEQASNIVPLEKIEKEREEKIAEIQFKSSDLDKSENREDVIDKTNEISLTLGEVELDDYEVSEVLTEFKRNIDDEEFDLSMDFDSDTEGEIGNVAEIEVSEVISNPHIDVGAVTKSVVLNEKTSVDIDLKTGHELEKITLDFEKSKKEELTKVKIDLENKKRIELERLNKLREEKELELKIIGEEFDNTKKIELEKIKFIEKNKAEELEVIKREKEELEALIKEEQVRFKQLEQEKIDQIDILKNNAMSDIEKECEVQKEKLLKEALSEVEKEKRNVLDAVEAEKDALLKKSKRLLLEAREEAELIVLQAERESRKKKDENYEEILESQRNNNAELLKLRRVAEQDAKEYYSNIREEAAQILEAARGEADQMKLSTSSELEYIKKSAESAAEIALSEADRIRHESSELTKHAKIKSDKMLKNAYATAMLIKNTNQEKFDVSDEQSFFEELEDEYPEFESQHQNKVQNIFSLINKTSEEMDEVLKEKQQIFEEESKHLRESELKRIQIEAREDAVKIKAQAESEAEEIIRSAYLHAKMIESEANSKIQEKQDEIFEIEKISNEEFEERYSEMKSIELKAKELEESVAELESVRGSLKTKLKDEQSEFEIFFNESSEQKKNYIQTNHELEIENKNWMARVSKAKKDFELFEIDSHEKKNDLHSKINVLSTDKEKLLVVITPLRTEVEGLRKEKTELYQENSHFFENLKTRKYEFEKLKEINESLEKTIGENKNTIQSSEELLHSKKDELGTLDFEIKNISSELKLKRDESVREREQILHDARVEEKQLREELEVIKSNKQAYAEKEIAELKRIAIEQCESIVSDGEAKKAELILDGTSEVDKLKSETNAWIKEVQAKIQVKNQEIEKVEEEGRNFLEERKIEAEKHYSERIALAISEIKKKEEESNKKIILVGEKFQEKMKQREEIFKSDQSEFFESIERKKIEIVKAANIDAQAIIAKTQAEAATILAEAKNKSEEALKQKDSILANIQSESNQLKSRLDNELVEHRKMAEKEISQMKVREFEAIKANRSVVEDQIENRKKSYVSDITENVGIQLQLRMKNAFGKELTDIHFDKLKSEIKNIVDSAVFPEKDEENQPKKLLMGSGKLTESVKKFYIKVAIGVLTPIVLLIINIVFPQFFPGIKNIFVSSIKTNESASDIFLQKEIDKKRNRPKYQPQYIIGFKETYVDNILYTEGYAESVVDPLYIDKWTISLNSYLVDELGLNDNLIVNIISYENNLHKQLLEIKVKINPDFIDQGIARLKEKELEYAPKIRALFKKERDYIFFQNFKRSFFNDFVKASKKK